MVVSEQLTACAPQYAWPVLTAGGRLYLALEMMLAHGIPSFDYWLDGSGPGGPGATTLWEN
jgi:hypothetical protein